MLCSIRINLFIIEIAFMPWLNYASFETPLIVNDRLQKGVKAMSMLFLEFQQINKLPAN